VSLKLYGRAVLARSGAAVTPSGDKWVVLYYGGWNQTTDAWDVDLAPYWDGLTHLCHFSATVNTDATLNYTTNVVGNATKRQNTVNAVHAADKLVFLSIGGAPGSANFLNATNSTNRAGFVALIVAEVAARGYDGVDVDWEATGETGAGDPNGADRPQYVAFLQALRAALPVGKLLMATVFGSWALAAADSHPHVDRVNLMTYIGAYNPATDKATHVSPINEPVPSPYLHGIDRCVTEVLAAGTPAAKLQFGFSRFAWHYVGATAINGTFTSVEDEQDYSTVPASGAVWDAAGRATYWNTSSPSQRIISAEDPISVDDKATYLRDRGLGGVIIWEHQKGVVGATDPLGVAVSVSFAEWISGGSVTPAGVLYADGAGLLYGDGVQVQYVGGGGPVTTTGLLYSDGVPALYIDGMAVEYA